MNSFIAGQRWISESEPELGLGTIVRAADGRVEVGFKSAGETRIYTVDQAPLKRIRFRVGDKIRTVTDQEFVVKQVVEEAGLLIYVGEGQRLVEADLSDRVSLQGPQERLLAGRFDQSNTFELRRRTLEPLALIAGAGIHWRPDRFDSASALHRTRGHSSARAARHAFGRSGFGEND